MFIVSTTILSIELYIAIGIIVIISKAKKDKKGQSSWADFL